MLRGGPYRGHSQNAYDHFSQNAEMAVAGSADAWVATNYPPAWNGG